MENKHIIINVGRQLGSGGHDIARMLALDFKAKYYDKEILNLAAKESGFSPKIFEQNDEKKGFIRGLFSMATPHVSSAYAPGFSQENLFKFQSDAIRKAAQEGSCVFVGRCADYVLRDFENVVNIFVTASMHDRVEQILNKQKVSPQEAKRIIQQAEGQRASYYNYYTGKKWGHSESYDLCVNTSILGMVETEKMIAEFIRKKFKL
ncbi:MAG: cytidylate kinase-like family protein [Prevotella sp.]|nr:cytidylate kinase-like family protein [Prevotella sp.]